MAIDPYAAWMLAQEARSLLTRLARVEPFALTEPMVPAAALLPSAQSAIESHLVRGRRELHAMVASFMLWLRGPQARAGSAADAQRRFTFLRLKFNATLTQFDLFNDVITQRSEHNTGVWLSGLDVVSADALHLPGDYYQAPPVICYLDRGPGAAIRRARTRLPGGGDNPVAIIRVPRERMIGSGIASSLIHEVGHQGAALLDLVNSLRPVLQSMQHGGSGAPHVWRLWERWISEIVADFWSLLRVGVVATLGLIGVVSLPRTFVFRLSADDPHPVPWLRVKLSCAMGRAVYPHPQWDRIEQLWQAYYPLDGVPAAQRQLLEQLQRGMAALAGLLLHHRPPALRGATLAEVMDVAARQPAALQALYTGWNRTPQQMYRTAPSLVFAVIGQARADGRLNPEDESTLLARLLTYWALRSTLDTSQSCAGMARPEKPARPPLHSTANLRRTFEDA
ncbi:hypothetical protein [Janthinobacterium agaricidamnosum]|uniref:Uncharacterized protein n=1 Tax=Janthinobacterium agaricidamnosum NBRC 102515 = DSM 9628 TaxID=1349767 RepID=W0V1Z1_9BURK|nr:hypothetical protein [Janthinobacterium agaricidamnosum]CDG82844.1 putative uncharacterized protein [Janthinobacterium agaricidamnosum NBRC 102515 = DSM 9628]